MKNNKKYVYGSMVLATFLVLATVVASAPAFAEDGGSGDKTDGGFKVNAGFNLGVRAGDRNENDNDQGGDRGGMMRGGIFGTVSAVSGNTITVSGKQGFGVNATTATTFTVDATNARIMKNGVVGTVTNILVDDTIMVQGQVNGTNIVATMIRDGMPTMMNRGKQAIQGTVSAISGNTITITTNFRPQGKNMMASVPVTYTVDATNAVVVKNGIAGTVSSIAVGDKVAVQGTITGTNIVATMIRDGKNEDEGKTTPPVITGDGNPIIVGTVSTVSGSTITITNKSNVTFTVNATNAKIVKGPNTISVSGITVGDTVIVQGTINGNAVVATSVIDQAKPAASNDEGNKGEGRGFFGGIGAFFSHLFGF